MNFVFSRCNHNPQSHATQTNDTLLESGCYGASNGPLAQLKTKHPGGLNSNL